MTDNNRLPAQVEEPAVLETDASGARHIIMTEVQLKRLVAEGVDDALTRLGVDPANPIEMQKDFQHLRDWREATDSVRRKGMTALIGVLVAGGCAALWVGIKDLITQ